MLSLCLLITFSQINISQNYMLESGLLPPSASNEENRKASLIVGYTKQKVDQCYDDLGRSLNNLCINLDVDKRMKLAIAIMLCEQKRDGRADNLPPYDSDLSFITNLDPNNFNIFTIYFINIDTICFHSVRENISSANMEKILSVFQAVSLSTEFLANAKKNLDELMMHVKYKLQKYQELYEKQQIKFQSIQNSVIQMIQTVKFISEKAMDYKYFVSNAKLYIIFLGIAFVLSFVLPNVFLPVLFVIGLFLFIEVSSNDDQKYVSRSSFKYIFITLCTIIFAIGFGVRFYSLKEAESSKKIILRKSKLQISDIYLYENIKPKIAEKK